MPDEFRNAAAIDTSGGWGPTLDTPPEGSDFSYRTWGQRTARARAIANHELESTGRMIAPTIDDPRDGLLLVWAIDNPIDETGEEPGEPLRLVRLDVYDPDRVEQSRVDRVLRVWLRKTVPIGRRTPVDLSLVGTTLGIGGASVAGVANALVGDPLGGLLAVLAGGIAAVAGGLPLLHRRADRGWRSIDLTQRDPMQRPLPVCRTLIDAHVLGTWLAERSEAAAADALFAVNAIHWLAWEAAGVHEAAGSEPAPFGAIDDAARELRGRLASLNILTPTGDEDRSAAAATRNAGRRALRERVQRVRALEDSDSAIELAQIAAADLDALFVPRDHDDDDDDQPSPE
ncbi:MAG: hypothetical protein LC798_11935 [Chloroflexi bacterium]|nr:hypothetical protein [Chloroflexota bacterium]